MLLDPLELWNYWKYGIMDSPEPPCECWECNPGSLQEQNVLLNAALFLQP